MFLRDPDNDKLKSISKIREQTQKKLTCTLDGCNNPLTNFQGPKDNSLCRSHQLQLREYGGLGRTDRPWTFARKWACDWCGYSPLDDPWFENPPIPFDNEVHKNQVMRGILVGDHNIRRIDGGDDSEENVQTLCQNCNSKKTNLFKDYKRGFICD